MRKVYDCLVCETGTVHTFNFQSDANRFVDAQMKIGNHVIRGIAWVSV